jgi:hypothetical protein
MYNTTTLRYPTLVTPTWWLHRTDSLACSHTAPLRIIGYPGRTYSPTASPDLHISPDNRLPKADSLASSLAGSLRYSGQSAAQDKLTRLQLHRITLRIFADRLPGHVHAGSRPPTTYSPWQWPAAARTPEQTSQPAPQPSAPSPPPTQTTRSGRRVRFPARFNEGVMWEHPTDIRTALFWTSCKHPTQHFNHTRDSRPIFLEMLKIKRPKWHVIYWRLIAWITWQMHTKFCWKNKVGYLTCNVATVYLITEMNCLWFANQTFIAHNIFFYKEPIATCFGI